MDISMGMDGHMDAYMDSRRGMGTGGRPAGKGAAAPVGPEVLQPVMPVLQQLLGMLHGAQHTMSLQCGTSTLGWFLPAVKRLPGFKELHKENYEVSYHLSTACGSAHMLLAGAGRPELLATIADCLREAREHEEKAREHCRRMRQAAPASVQPLLEQIQGYLQATLGQMERAQGLLTHVLGPDQVGRLVAWAEAQQ